MEQKKYNGYGMKYTPTSHERNREASSTRPLKTHSDQCAEQDDDDRKLCPHELAVNCVGGRNEKSAPSSPVDAAPIDPILTSLAATAYSPRARGGSFDLLTQALEPSPQAAVPPEAHTISSTAGTFANGAQYGYNKFRMENYPPEPPRSLDVPTLNPAGDNPLEPLLPAIPQMPPWQEQAAPRSDQMGSIEPAYLKQSTMYSSARQSFPSTFSPADLVPSSQNPLHPPPSRLIQGEADTDLSTTEARREHLMPPALPVPPQPSHYHHLSAPIGFQTNSAEGRPARAMLQRRSVLALAERLFTKRQIREMHAEADRLTAIHRQEAGLEMAGREDDSSGSTGGPRGRAGAARSGAVSRRGGRSSGKRSRHR